MTRWHDGRRPRNWGKSHSIDTTGEGFGLGWKARGEKPSVAMVSQAFVVCPKCPLPT